MFHHDNLGTVSECNFCVLQKEGNHQVSEELKCQGICHLLSRDEKAGSYYNSTMAIQNGNIVGKSDRQRLKKSSQVCLAVRSQEQKNFL